VISDVIFFSFLDRSLMLRSFFKEKTNKKIEIFLVKILVSNLVLTFEQSLSWLEASSSLWASSLEPSALRPA